MIKTILILGAGTGGIVTANQLRKNLSAYINSNQIRIILFEKEEKNVFAPSLLCLMVGKRKANQVYKSTKLLARKGIELVLGEIEIIDPGNITVTVGGQSYSGDYMVISLGVEQAVEHSLDTFADNFYTLDGAQNFYSKLQTFNGGKIAILVPSLPFKCPAAPYEAALLIADFIAKKGLTARTKISLFTPELGPMGVAGKVVSSSVKNILEQKGINLFSEYQLTTANENSLTFSNGLTQEFDLLCYTPKHNCPRVIQKTNLVGKSGWIDVDRNNMETSFNNVYAIGDITNIPLEMGRPLPKAGVFAHYQAEVVAFNISQKIMEKSSFKSFNGEGQCFLEIGSNQAAFASGNFYGSPLPQIKINKPAYFWHWTKIAFEKYWFFKYF